MISLQLLAPFLEISSLAPLLLAISSLTLPLLETFWPFLEQQPSLVVGPYSLATFTSYRLSDYLCQVAVTSLHDPSPLCRLEMPVASGWWLETYELQTVAPN